MTYLAAAVTALLAAPVVFLYVLFVAGELFVVCWLLWRLRRWNPFGHDARRCAICRAKNKRK